jgi:hypothetical protein
MIFNKISNSNVFPKNYDGRFLRFFHTSKNNVREILYYNVKLFWIIKILFLKFYIKKNLEISQNFKFL